jgi:hypothetical protein
MSNLVDVLRKRFLSVVLWQTLFVLSVAGGFVAVHLNTLAMMKPIRFAALNSRDTYYFTPAGRFESVPEAHLEMGKLAVETMFDRSPDGLDNPERVDHLFNSRCGEQLKGEVVKDADIFRAQQIHQKIEISRVREVQLGHNSAALEISGQVIQTGFLDQRIAQTRDVTVNVNLMPNDEIEQNKKYPLVVWAYEVFRK